jgi:hypothetical protein
MRIAFGNSHFRLSKKLFYRKHINGIEQRNIKKQNTIKQEKPKAFIEKALGLLAFFSLALWRTLARRRMQERKIYLPFSKSPSVSRLSRHAEK